MQPLERESSFIKTYVKKDGTVVQKEYKTKYLVKDKTAQNLRKEIKIKLSNASSEQLQKALDALDGGRKDIAHNGEA